MHLGFLSKKKKTNQNPPQRQTTKIKYWTLRQVNSPADFTSSALPRQPEWPRENTSQKFKNGFLPLHHSVSVLLFAVPYTRHLWGETTIPKLVWPVCHHQPSEFLTGHCAILSSIFQRPFINDLTLGT